MSDPSEETDGEGEEGGLSRRWARIDWEWASPVHRSFKRLRSVLPPFDQNKSPCEQSRKRGRKRTLVREDLRSSSEVGSTGPSSYGSTSGSAYRSAFDCNGLRAN